MLPLIIDTDPGVDDLLAILLAIATPEVSLEAITLTFGNTTLDYAYDNILRIAHALNEAGKIDGVLPARVQARVRGETGDAPVPVALGATKPLGGHLFTASYFHGRDGMSGVSFLEGDPHPVARSSAVFATTPSKLDAADTILDVLRRHPPHTVRIAAVAPLTNLAVAYQRDPATFRRVGLISVMGGAIDVPGNTSPCAEFNFFADPWAAKFLLEDAAADGALPIHLFPLDITTRHVVPYSQLVRQPGDPLYDSSPLVRLISAFMRKPRAVTNACAGDEVFDPAKHDLFEGHDPLAVAYAIAYEPGSSAWDYALREFVVETDGKHTRGFCVVDRRNHGSTYSGRNKAELEAKRGPHNEHGVERHNLDDAPTHSAPLIHVVTHTPGSKWFGDMLLSSLGISI
ncbi:hypothetical protein MCUN1_000234 [Malassezia cuniculi]|uniref:Inosine/uridine-preferring nucleoside hydrolase domain-containing protein n=1 Tax=Malassezia cuniculi TaxID=948313 RepID=A0AAF0J9L0_9BASI|nr:hypothetical protein MCUN1_000234 [Malassezia cuniculi]